MASYISYAERQAADQINWAEIGKNLSDTLYKEAELRQQKKDEIDKKSREYGETLNNAITGEYKNGNEWILNYAYNAQEARLLQDRLLKSGQLSLRDYTIGRQNLESGTKSLFAVNAEMQQEYARKMKEYQEGTTSGATIDMMGEIEGLANLTTTEAYINPTTFDVNLATKKMNKDGVYEMDGNFVSVASLRNRVKMDVKKYDIDAGVDETIKTLGQATRTEISRVKGARGLFTVKSVIDARNRDDLTADNAELIGDYIKWEDNAISSILTNDFSKLSILRDSSEKDYQVTFDREAFENDKTGKLILMDQQSNGVLLPKFKKEQEDDAKEILKNRIRNGIDQETKVTAVREEPTPRPPYKPPGVEDTDKLTSLENWAMFGTGTAKQKAQAKNALLNDFNSGKKEGERLLDIIVDTDNNQMTFKYDDGTESSSTIPSNTRDWLNLGKFIHGVEGKDAQRAFSQFLNKPITTDFSEAAKTKIKKFNRTSAIRDIMSSIDFNNLIVEDDDNATAANLNANPILRDLGIQFISDDAAINDEIIFTKPYVKGKESPTIRIPLDSEEEIANAIQTIRGIISSYTYDEDMMKYSMGDGTSSGITPDTTMQGGDVRGE
jgi:hypothetical protein